MRRSGPRSAAVTAAEAVLFWALGTGVWLLTLSTVTGSEVILAVAAGLLSAVAAVGTRRLIGVRWGLPRRWGSSTLLLPLTVMIESARLLTRTLGSDRWTSDAHPISVSRGAGSAEGAAAVATVLMSATPATVVVDVDGATLLVHELVRMRAPEWASPRLPARPSSGAGSRSDGPAS